MSQGDALSAFLVNIVLGGAVCAAELGKTIITEFTLIVAYTDDVMVLARDRRN